MASFNKQTKKWRGQKMINGVRKSRQFNTKKEAELWEAQQLVLGWTDEGGAGDAGATASVRIAQNLGKQFEDYTLKVFFEEYLSASERFVKRTYREKVLSLRRCLEIIPPETLVSEVTNSMAMKVLRHVSAKVSGAQANRVRKNLAACWKWGNKYLGTVSLNPFAACEKLAADESPRYVPPLSDFWKVYGVAREHDKIFLLFMLHTGARRGEVFRLKWVDVDIERRQVKLGTRKTKGGGMKYNFVPMTKELTKALRDLRKRSLSEYVFTNPVTQEPYRARLHTMARLCEQAGVKPFGFHAIRHLTGTIMAYSGTDFPTVQHVLRHASPTTTARYIKNLGIDPEKMDAVFAEAPL